MTKKIFIAFLLIVLSFQLKAQQFWQPINQRQRFTAGPGLGLPVKDSTLMAVGDTAYIYINKSDSLIHWRYKGWDKKVTPGGTVTGWGLTGNSGTSPGTNFLGTTDNVSFEGRVNNIRALYIGRADSGNTVLGYNALVNINQGGGAVWNIGVGTDALTELTTGYDNIGIGHYAGQKTTTAAYNTFVGPHNSRNINGNYNTGLGALSGYSDTRTSAATGSYNTYIGASSAQALTSGYSNTFLGTGSGLNLTSGNSNILLGDSSGQWLTTESNRIILNSIPRADIAADTNASPIYIAQDATASNQRLYINSQFLLPYASSQYNGADSMMVILPSTGKVGYRVIPTGNPGTVTSVATGLGLSGGTITSSGTIVLDTASSVVLSRQRAALTYAPISVTGNLTVGTTTIASGTNTRVLYNNSGVLGEYTVTGSGNVAMSADPAFTSAATTGTGLSLTANSLTTGTGFDASTSSITTGNLMRLASTSTAANDFGLLSIVSSGANASSTRTATGLKINVSNTGTSSTSYGADISVTGATNNRPARFIGGTSGVIFQEQSSGYFGLYSSNVTPGSSNYGLILQSSNTYVNAPSDLNLCSAGAIYLYLSGGIQSRATIKVNSSNAYDLGESGTTWRTGYFGTSVVSPKFQTTTSVFWSSGAGSPEGVVTASPGALYTNTSGGANTTLYVKESGTGNTGWVAK